jgi:two-component system, chemotaxis family, sensor kinase CheA
MKDIRQKLLATFQIEHRDHIEQIRSLLAMIEKTSGQPQGTELDEVFRRAHSLKGAARAVDLHQVEGLAHRLETLFSRVRQGQMPLDKSVAGVVQQVLDASEDCVMALGENRPTLGFEPALRALEQVLQIEPGPADRIEPEAAPATPVPAFQPLEMVRITTQNFDGLLRSAGGLLGECQRQNQLTVQLQDLSHQIAVLEKESETVQRQLAAPEFARIRSYFDSSKRQTRVLANQTRSVRRLHQRCSWGINRLGKQLQLDVWRARMVPAESLLEGYRKMMRDLARDEGKEIEFHAVSTGVHADRRILEALKDPLIHILRNAVNHGIELPHERVAKGKPQVGSVSLRIGSVGQRLTILVEDDGRGVDFARAAEVAVRQGILSEADAASRSPEQLALILFRAGFSTSQSVTELAGRGMGLSVVHEAIRRLQGNVELHPRDGGGTAIQMSVPLSISTHKLLMVDCCGWPFAIPIHVVERLHRIKQESVSTVEGEPVVLLGGQPVRLFSLNQMLGLTTSSEVTPKKVLSVAALRLKSGLTAVAVDAFLWESDAVIQDLGSVAPDGISGAILLEDGKIAMVINPDELMESSGPRQQAFWNPPKMALGQPLPSILVVDDSMTTRALEKSILEANGYLVRVAVDGVEALDCLGKEKVDLVITDIQMPRMDGFDLLEAMKKNPDLNKIPVIVVTSLDRREDQERGLQLGADAYIVKRKFDQAELLSAIRQIL